MLARLRATVLVSDGMLSAFETRTAGPARPWRRTVVEAGGHGGELLRGGYAKAAGRRPGGPGRRSRGGTVPPDHAPPGPAAAGRRAKRTCPACSRRPRRWPAVRWPPSTTSTWRTGRAAGRPPPGRRTCCGHRSPSPCSPTQWCGPRAPSRCGGGSATGCTATYSACSARECWISRWRAALARRAAHPGYRGDRPAPGPGGRRLAAGRRQAPWPGSCAATSWTTARQARCSASSAGGPPSASLASPPADAHAAWALATLAALLSGDWLSARERADRGVLARPRR